MTLEALPVTPQNGMPEQAETVHGNPTQAYAEFSAERLGAIKLNLMDSVAHSIGDSENLDRSCGNLLDVEREIHGRTPSVATDESSPEGFTAMTALGEEDTAAIADIIINTTDTDLPSVWAAAWEARSKAEQCQSNGDQLGMKRAMEESSLLKKVSENMMLKKASGWEDYRVNDLKGIVFFGAGAEAVPTQAGVTAEAPVERSSVQNREYLGPKREIDPRIEELVNNADWINDRDREEIAKKAMLEASHDATQNMVITQMGDGENYWAAEYPNVFTFNGQMRGYHENFNDDPAEETAAEFLSGPGGSRTHVIIETDDGHVYLFRRTNDEKSASKQEFQVTSTRLNIGRGEDTTLSRKIRTEQLKDVVVMPGHELVLGEDPKTGRRLRTGGNAVRITAISKSEDKKVPANHPFLKRPDRFRDAPARFITAMEEARKQDVASKVGELATH